MTTAINRTTFKYYTNVSDSLDQNEWLINPDLVYVSGVPQKYWKVVGNNVLEMTDVEKNLKDQWEAEVAALAQLPDEVVVTSGIEQATINIDGPRNADGKNVFTVNPFPKNIYVYYTAKSDHIPSGLRGVGDRFKVESTGVGVYTVDAQFIDILYMTGGETTIVGETHPDDYANIELVAPATPVAFVPGGTGNCNVIPVAGKQLIIPATGNGFYNVDVEVALNSNLENKSFGAPGKVTKATPITSFGDSGFWDWDENSGDITPSYTMTGGYNLFAEELIMARFANGVIVHASPLTQYKNVQYNVPVKASKVLPHWVIRGTIYAHGSGNFSAAWMLYTAREYSVD